MPGPAKRRLLNLLEKYKDESYYVPSFSYEITTTEVIVNCRLPNLVKNPIDGTDLNRLKVVTSDVKKYLCDRDWETEGT